MLVIMQTSSIYYKENFEPIILTLLCLHPSFNMSVEDNC